MARRKKLYAIQYLDSAGAWRVLLNWWALPECKAEGAWMALKAFQGGGQNYRPVTSHEAIVEEFSSGHVGVNNGDNGKSAILVD